MVPTNIPTSDTFSSCQGVEKEEEDYCKANSFAASRLEFASRVIAGRILDRLETAACEKLIDFLVQSASD